MAKPSFSSTYKEDDIKEENQVSYTRIATHLSLQYLNVKTIIIFV